MLLGEIKDTRISKYDLVLLSALSVCRRMVGLLCNDLSLTCAESSMGLPDAHGPLRSCKLSFRQQHADEDVLAHSNRSPEWR